MKQKESEKELKEKTKELSIREGASYKVMDGAGLRYITPYALSIGANNAQIGFLTSIPLLLGNFSQLLTSKIIGKYSRKKIMLTGVFLQALMWIPILFVGYLFFYKGIDHGFSANLLIVFYTLLILFGAFVSPVWNSLMKDVVGKRVGAYFGHRNKILEISVLVVMLISGLILNYFKKTNLFLGFLILFGAACVARLVSAYFLKKHYEPKLKLEKGYYFKFTDFIKKIPKSNFGKFALFIALIAFGATIASPFFAVYMLKDLNFSYITYTIIIVCYSLSYLVFMPLWGKFADRFGSLKVLRWTGAMIFLIPLLWFLTIFFVKINIALVIGYLIGLEIFAGFVWAGFNLSIINFIYDAVSNQKIALCVAYFNIMHGVGVFIGASLGGIISSFNFTIFGISSILFVFLLSGAVRFFIYIIMISKIKEVRRVEEYKDGEFGEEMKKGLLPISFKTLKRHHHHSNNHVHLPIWRKG